MTTFIDDYSRYIWVYFVKKKSEALDKFKEFKMKVESDIVRRKNECVHILKESNYLTI